MGKIYETIKKVSLRDVMLVAGFSLFGYGLFLFVPWVSFAVCGLLLLVGGFFVGEK